jgi:hypothetical protein
MPAVLGYYGIQNYKEYTNRWCTIVIIFIHICVAAQASLSGATGWLGPP